MTLVIESRFVHVLKDDETDMTVQDLDTFLDSLIEMVEAKGWGIGAVWTLADADKCELWSSDEMYQALMAAPRPEREGVER